MSTPSDHRVWVAAGLTIVLWASAFAAIRAALEGLTVTELSVLRLALASLALLAVAPLKGLRRPRARDLPRLVAAGLTGMASYQLLLNAGERTVTAGTASILVNTGPVFVALLATHFLGEGLTRRGWSGVAIGFTGALIIALASSHGLSLSPGALLVLGAAVAQATFFVIQKPLLNAYTPYEATTYAMSSGAILLLPVAGPVPAAITHVSAQTLEAVAFLALGPSAIGFFTWAYASARLDVSRAASALYTVPVVAILVAWAWLGELPTVAAIAGGTIAIAGVLLTNTGRIRDSSKKRAARSTSDCRNGHHQARASSPTRSSGGHRPRGRRV